MSYIRAHVFVSGKVQGVFFRDSTRESARALGVSGWVRNCADGRVEAIFEGEEPVVKRILEFVALGPEYADVTNVEVSYQEFIGEYDDFRIEPSVSD